jgi:hypothetical protein
MKETDFSSRTITTMIHSQENASFLEAGSAWQEKNYEKT